MPRLWDDLTEEEKESVRGLYRDVKKGRLRRLDD